MSFPPLREMQRSPVKAYPISAVSARRSAEILQVENYENPFRRSQMQTRPQRFRDRKANSLDLGPREGEYSVRMLPPKLELCKNGLRIIPEFEPIRTRSSTVSETPVKEEHELPQVVKEIFQPRKSNFRRTVGVITHEMIRSRMSGRMTTVRPRRKENSSKGKGEEEFWDTHISDENSIRWDLFEEAFSVYIDTVLEKDPRVSRKINWKVFFQKLFKSVGFEKKEYSIWPRSYSYATPPYYKGKIVEKRDFIETVLEGVFLKILVSSQQEGFTREGIRGGKGHQYIDGTSYTGEWLNGKKEGQGELRLRSGEVYTGNFSEGLREGRGKITGNQYEYEGEWKFDKFDGFGRMVFPDGSVYEGIWQQGNITKGKLHWGEGFVYEGEWKSNSFNGQGSLLLPNGDTHKGMWKKGNLEGRAKIKKKNGFKYKGIFEEGRLEGEGELVADEYSYEGEFINSLPHGKGVMVFNDGSRYEGEFTVGERHGNGSYKMPTGDHYIGEFEHNERTGRGIFEFLDGRKYEGDFLKGEIIGSGIMKYPEGHTFNRYVGIFMNENFHGRGTLWYRNGDLFDGEWKEGKYWGEGVLKIGNVRYNGEFENGVFHGYGEYERGRAWYFGDWKKGKADGRGEACDWNGEKYSGAFIKGVPASRSKIQQELLFCLKVPY